MEFKIQATLDKIIVNKNNIDETMKSIEKQFIKFNYGNFEIVSIQDGEKELCGPRLSYKYCDEFNRLNKDNPLYLTLCFKFSSLNFDNIKTIYYIYSYLEKSIINNQYLHITVTKEHYSFENLDNTKYPTTIATSKIIEKDTNDIKLDILDFLDYTVSSMCYRRDDFDKFLKELEVKSKYKDIIDNIDSYEKKVIPFNFNSKTEINYKNIDVTLVHNFHNVNDLINEAKKQKGIQTYILEQKNIEYNLMNTDFSNTTLRKYTLLDENMNLYYILEEINGYIDEGNCCLYLSTAEIPDEQISDFILFSDNQINNNLSANKNKEYDSDYY